MKATYSEELSQVNSALKNPSPAILRALAIHETCLATTVHPHVTGCIL